MSIHPTLDVLCTGGRDSVCRVWDIRTKAEVHCLEGHNNTVFSVATQGANPQIITGSMDSTIKYVNFLKLSNIDQILGYCRREVRYHFDTPQERNS